MLYLIKTKNHPMSSKTKNPIFKQRKVVELWCCKAYEI